MAENLLCGIVLAGGLSSRMGASKALLTFQGRPLALRALERLRPQVDRVYLSVREEAAPLAALGAPLVVDVPAHRGAGPLAGVAAALRRARADRFAFVATVPCDAPFFPRDLVAGLAEAGAPAVAGSASGLQPMFALWPVAALEAVEAALAAGEGGPRKALAALGARRVDFPERVFANLNTPQDFAAADAAADLLEGEPPAGAGFTET